MSIPSMVTFGRSASTNFTRVGKRSSVAASWWCIEGKDECSQLISFYEGVLFVPWPYQIKGCFVCALALSDRGLFCLCPGLIR